MRILVFLMLCTLWLPIAHAQESMLMGAESAPIIFQRESIRILPTAPEKPTEQTTEASPQNTIPNPRFPIVYSVEIRDERALGFDYIHALSQLNATNGVLIFFSAPTVTPLPRFQIHKPVDVLFINEQGVILEILPHAVCLVPEKREERTTEGGLDVAGNAAYLREYIAPLVALGMRVSMFVAPVEAQIQASKAIGAQVVELHTGNYAEFEIQGSEFKEELQHIQHAAALAASLGLEVHAGHGLNFENVGRIAAIPEIVELNIGHFLLGEAVFAGLAESICTMRRFMNEARA